MRTNVKIYDIKSFVRKNETGHLSRERISEIIREIVNISICFPEKNLLLDFRKTELPADVNLSDIMKFTLEAAAFGDILINKIASLIPEDPMRLSIAKKVRASMQVKGLKYQYFTDFEQAIEWLSNDGQ